MKLTLIGPAPPLRGGIAAHTRGLARALEAHGDAVAVVSYRRLYPRLLFPGRSQLDGSDAVGTAMLDTLSPATWLRLRHRLRTNVPDVVVVQWWHPLVAPAIATSLAGVAAPRVVICHNLVPHESFPGWRAAARFVLGRSNRVVCHSQRVAEQVAELVPDVPLVVCPMPLLLDATLRCEHDLFHGDDAAVRLLFVGHVRGYKGVDVLLGAWERAPVPDGATLTIAGESYLGRGVLERLVARCSRADAVRVVDRYLSDAELVSAVRSADVVVLPYRRASQSALVPLVRALGRRLIVADAGGLAEDLAPSNLTWVVPAGSLGALAVAIAEALAAAVAEGTRGRTGDAACQEGSGSLPPAVGGWERLAEACRGGRSERKS